MPLTTVHIQDFLNSIQSVYSTGHATEHSYRPALEILLRAIGQGLSVVNEPKRQKVGAPDFIIYQNDVQIAFVEAKDIPEKLSDKKHKNQIERYQALGNLCFTNNLEWQFFVDSGLVSTVIIAEVIEDKIVPKPENYEMLIGYLSEFVAKHSITIRSSKQLATVMAGKAKAMREILVKILEEDEIQGLKSEVYNEYETFRTLLIHDLTIAKFADIYSQTITYELFTARYYDKSLNSFSRQEAANNLPKSNPFLRKLFQTIAGYDLDTRLAWVVDNLVDAFGRTNVCELMQGFGKATKMADPVLHFYENFLGEYDPVSRKKAGVYYTPDPVVKFIVRSVDEILQKDFGLPMGLADNSKISRKVSEQVGKHDLKSRVEIKANGHREYYQDFHKVQVLDPATGTGTFLLEVFHQIHSKFQNNQGIWKSYAKNDLIPRVHGFELLMASYSMAHLKLAMYLSETGVDIEDRLSVYLTNSLEEGIHQERNIFAQWLSEESHQANKIKTESPVMVVIGNPPYSVSSSNSSVWITNLIQDYKKDLNEKNIQPLSDDYIKFIRFGHHFIQKNGEGVMAYISNNSFLDGIIHRKMREELLKDFDSIYVIDLHGNSKKKEVSPDGSKDENVFDIQQGVSINIFVKMGKGNSTQLATVHHKDLYGLRQAKYDYLSNHSVKNTDWMELQPDDKYHFFVPKDFGEQEEYEKGVKLSELFGVFNVGVETGDDKFYVATSKDELEKKFQSNIIYKFNYHPLDTRFIGYKKESLRRPIIKIMPQLMGENLALCFVRQSKNDKASTIIAKNLVNRDFLTNHTQVAPLYLYPEEGQLGDTNPTPNFDPKIIGQIELELGMKLDWSAGIGETKRLPLDKGLATELTGVIFTPTDLLDYIYASLHSPSYRETYKEFLKIDFPRVGFGVGRERFWELVAIGGELRQLHLMEGLDMTKLITGYPIDGNNIVEKVRYEDNRVWINDTQYWDNVSEVAYNFYIGGYQPAQKWLKDRKNQELSFADILHYQQIIHILKKTDVLMKRIG